MFSESERYNEGYFFSKYLDVFLEKKIGTMLGISFDDFINRPRYEVQLILNRLNKFQDRELGEREHELRKLGQVAKNAPKLEL